MSEGTWVTARFRGVEEAFFSVTFKVPERVNVIACAIEHMKKSVIQANVTWQITSIHCHGDPAHDADHWKLINT